jgi:hypothetical protein
VDGAESISSRRFWVREQLFQQVSDIVADVTTGGHWCVQELHGGVLLKISSAAEDDVIRLNLLWTGFFGETCKPLTGAFKPQVGG